MITLGLGVPADFRAAAPWLLGGAKTLSYAVNMAALRYAAAQGADDVVFVSLDGQVLEGPTSTVVWSTDGVLHTPPPETGILPGTTMARLFARAAEAGRPTAVTPGTVDGPARRRRGVAGVGRPLGRHGAHPRRRGPGRRGPLGAAFGSCSPGNLARCAGKSGRQSCRRPSEPPVTALPASSAAAPGPRPAGSRPSCARRRSAAPCSWSPPPSPLVWANSPWADAYATLRDTRVGPAALHLDLTLGTWAADGLLAIFFFVAGLELKREFVAGDLRDPRRAALPVAAAVGGMAVPALLFVAGQPRRRGRRRCAAGRSRRRPTSPSPSPSSP